MYDAHRGDPEISASGLLDSEAYIGGSGERQKERGRDQCTEVYNSHKNIRMFYKFLSVFWKVLGLWGGFWQVWGKCLGGFWKIFGGILDDFGELFGRFLDGKTQTTVQKDDNNTKTHFEREVVGSHRAIAEWPRKTWKT